MNKEEYIASIPHQEWSEYAQECWWRNGYPLLENMESLILEEYNNETYKHFAEKWDQEREDEDE